MFYQIFLSPQVKRIVIISNKHGIYELPHELPNDSYILARIDKIWTAIKICTDCCQLNKLVKLIKEKKRELKENFTFP